RRARGRDRLCRPALRGQRVGLRDPDHRDQGGSARLRLRGLGDRGGAQAALPARAAAAHARQAKGPPPGELRAMRLCASFRRHGVAAPALACAALPVLLAAPGEPHAQQTGAPAAPDPLPPDPLVLGNQFYEKGEWARAAEQYRIVTRDTNSALRRAYGW